MLPKKLIGLNFFRCESKPEGILIPQKHFSLFATLAQARLTPKEFLQRSWEKFAGVEKFLDFRKCPSKPCGRLSFPGLKTFCMDLEALLFHEFNMSASINKQKQYFCRAIIVCALAVGY